MTQGRTYGIRYVSRGFTVIKPCRDEAEAHVKARRIGRTKPCDVIDMQTWAVALAYGRGSWPVSA